MAISQNLAELPRFKQIQYTFTRHVRDPAHAPAPPGIEDRRMAIYRDLLYRNVESFISNNFPVLRKITPDERWHEMVRDYFMRHESHTPYFPKMPREFLQYLENERNHENDPPFIRELAHYEWVELGVSIDPREINLDGINPNGNLLEGVPVISPVAWPVQYDYPVHAIAPDNLPEIKPDNPIYIVVYRNRKDEVGFIELNPVSARLLALIQEDKNLTGRKLLKKIARELQHPHPEVVIKGGEEIMRNLQEKDILLGIK